ncbi:MFS transporter [Tellurirhabdus rosea]|uniref:MFS transporter n=1 Tax=Tellurirhabdus rosea TaxID=2674997 RepID=UPI002251F0F8|nr:MFS transporter [Tellurirhabdus rosea]
MIQQPLKKESLASQLLSLPVMVAALGYLVDMYDLFLFSVVRVPSLKALGVTPDQLLPQGIFLLNMQMAGLLLGGIFWGIMGDKRGRLSVLFGSILIYSLANIGNGLVTSMPQYALLRFIAGVGLAGELGAGITLVTEVLPRQIRGYGTTIVATMGVLGAILAYFVADLFEWRNSYFVGGGMGLLLLLLRVNVFESSIFEVVKERQVKRGDLWMLITSRERLLKYFQCILVGMPIWFVVGVLITFSPEFGQAMGLTEPVVAGKAVMLAFVGQVVGDVLSGLLSQYLQNRKQVVGGFILLSFAFVLVFLLAPLQNVNTFYGICILLGVANGYWALFVTIAAELFGTNLRATVATTVPNFVRGTVIPLTTLFVWGKNQFGTLNSALGVGLLTVALSLIALYYMEETFRKDLNYVEKD